MERLGRWAMSNHEKNLQPFILKVPSSSSYFLKQQLAAPTYFCCFPVPATVTKAQFWEETSVTGTFQRDHQPWPDSGPAKGAEHCTVEPRFPGVSCWANHYWLVLPGCHRVVRKITVLLAAFRRFPFSPGPGLCLGF